MIWKGIDRRQTPKDVNEITCKQNKPWQKEFPAFAPENAQSVVVLHTLL
jgi:hypothetical protein